MSLDWEKLLCDERVVASEKLKNDCRSEFERDYDRAVFSTAVRRLQDKAQVFPLESNDAIRTRLTHSLEVASIARTLGYYCAPFIIKSAGLPEARRRDIEMLCQTCGLLHDIGNPPFGHAGEEAIAGWFKQLQSSSVRLHGKDVPLIRALKIGVSKAAGSQRVLDFEKFDGNSQTFRILTRLQLAENHAGLNLTYATLAVLLKYTAKSNQRNKNWARSKKQGFFSSENDLVRDVRNKTGVGKLRHPLTYLVEAADDIAYSVIDIEDALKKGVISWWFLRGLIKDAEQPKFASLDPFADRAQAIVKAAEDRGDFKGKPFEREHAYAGKFRTLLITSMVDSIRRAFESNYPSIMDGSMRDALEKRCDMKDEIEACKLVTRKYVYFAKETLKLEIMGRTVVSDLLNLFWEGVIGYDAKAKSFHFPNKVWEILSANYRHVYEQRIPIPVGGSGGDLDYYSALHLVTDHVCGMTDSFACRLHRELFNSA